MALEVLKDNLNDEMKQLQKEQESLVGCRIKCDDKVVKIFIPSHFVKTLNSNKFIKIDDEVLTFSKREVKELLQDLYMN